MLHRIELISAGGTAHIYAEHGKRLIEALRENAALDFPCGGRGRCGKCRVLVAGEAGEAAREEVRILGVRGLQNGERLACFARVTGDLRVTVPGADTAEHEGAAPEARVKRKFSASNETPLGIACDIGTTTMAVRLVELDSGMALASEASLNPQRSYGADVISRLGYAAKSADALIGLSAIARKSVSELAETACEAAGRKTSHIKRAVFAGNPAMLHIFAQKPVSGLIAAPFAPAYSEAFSIPAGELGLNFGCGATAVIGGCVSGFVGADTVFGVLACGMGEGGKNALFLDIGTNGEIVLSHNGSMYACSAAAGPAFEGGHIRFGTGALTGAIYGIGKDGGVLTVGDAEAIGICGSGLVDVAAHMLKTGAMDRTGHILAKDVFRGEPAYRIGGSDIYVTQNDVRELQLAKAAIAAGIEILLYEAGAGEGEIQTIYLCGGFGNSIDVESAREIGLIPKHTEAKVLPLGNAALAGAALVLTEPDGLERAERLREKMEYIELSAHALFNDKYISHMDF